MRNDLPKQNYNMNELKNSRGDNQNEPPTTEKGSKNSSSSSSLSSNFQDLSISYDDHLDFNDRPLFKPNPSRSLINLKTSLSIILILSLMNFLLIEHPPITHLLSKIRNDRESSGLEQGETSAIGEEQGFLNDFSNWSIENLLEDKDDGSVEKIPELEYELIRPSRPSLKLTSSAPNQSISSKDQWNFVVLHGLGDFGASQAHLISDSFKSLDKALFSNFNFIIPHANLIKVSVFEDQVRPGWFDIRDWDRLYKDEDLIGLNRNLKSLQLLISNLNLDLNRTIIGGFSQGAVMSLLLTLTLKKPPRLTVMMSGYFPVPTIISNFLSNLTRNTTHKIDEKKEEADKSLKKKMKNNLRMIKLIWFHGSLDPYFKIEFIKKNFDRLRRTLKDTISKLKSSPPNINYNDRKSHYRLYGRYNSNLHKSRKSSFKKIYENHEEEEDDDDHDDDGMDEEEVRGGREDKMAKDEDWFIRFKEIKNLDHNWNLVELKMVADILKKIVL